MTNAPRIMKSKFISLICYLLFLFANTLSNSTGAESSLLTLTMQRNIDSAIRAIEEGANPNQVSSDNSTALLYSAHFGEVSLTRALLDAGADPTIRNNYGTTALNEAAINDHIEIIELLLQHGVNPDQANDEGETPLMLVARAGNINASRLLIEYGADINAREQWGGQTALMWATAQRQTQVMELLIKNGADINLQGYPRLWERPMTSETRPKDMNKGGFSALQYAARQGCIACIEILIDANVDINAIDPDRVSALNLALLNFHFDSAAVLINAGANIDQWDIYGRNPLYNAIDMNTVPSTQRADIPSEDSLSGIDIARMLLERGANPNAQLKLRPPFRNVAYDRGSDKMLAIGATPLMAAVSIGDVESVQLLLEYGALAELPNMYGTSPFLFSAGVNFSFVPTRGLYKTEDNTLRIMQLLLDAGANINSLSGDPALRPNGNTISRPDRRSQMSPADRGPEVIEGKNALHGAARHGWLQVAQFLIENGVQQQVVDDAGRTPLDYAKGLYPAAFNDSPALPNEAMIELLISACEATDNCQIDESTLN